jgi:DNA-binding NtrC family response regulator
LEKISMAKTPASILIVDDDPAIRTASRMFLKQLFTLIVVESDPEKIPGLMDKQRFDVILLDMNFTPGRDDGSEGMHWLGRILQKDPGAVVVFVTAFGEVDLAVEAMKSGAFDFIVKPWKNDKLLGVIRTALKLNKTRRIAEKYRQRQDLLLHDMDQLSGTIIGRSPAMGKIFSMIEKVAETDAEVLLLGENGSGKELIAREIHKQSGRSNEVFISVDLGAIHENLFESELFGHVKGAFTDARQDKPGRFELAAGGTLFLDEIGNLRLPLQAKLLSVIENRRLTPVGSNKEIDVDVRIICATNMPLNDMVRSKDFREDLLYRINTIEIRIPPLRNRTGDIQLLARYYLDMYKRKYNKSHLRLPAPTINRLEKYDWPGNVRELRHSIERAVILSEGNTLEFGDLLTDHSFRTSSSSEEILDLAEMEKRYILKAISKHHGNITKAAAELGIARAALYRRLEKHGL